MNLQVVMNAQLAGRWSGTPRRPCFLSKREQQWAESLLVGVGKPGHPRTRTIPHPNAGLLSTGMCLQAFVEAFFYLAQRKFKMLPLHEQVASLIDLCEYHLSLQDEKRLVCGRSGISSGSRLQPSATPQEAAPAAPPAEGRPQPCTDGAHKVSHSRHSLS